MENIQERKGGSVWPEGHTTKTQPNKHRKSVNKTNNKKVNHVQSFYYSCYNNNNNKQ